MPEYLFRGLKLQYSKTGKGVPALVFVPGLMGSQSQWKAQVRHFSHIHLVITVDVFGFGRSSSAGSPYDGFLATADGICSLIRSEIGCPYVAIGHSAAGLTLCRLLRSQDSLLTGVIFVDAPFGLPNREFWQRHELDGAADSKTPVLVIDAAVGTKHSAFKSLVLLFHGCEHIKMDTADHGFFSARPELLTEPIEKFLRHCSHKAG